MAFVITAVLIGPIVMHDTSRQANAVSQMILNPTSGVPGTVVSYTLYGTPIASPYHIAFNGQTVFSGITDQAGQTTFGSFTVPNTQVGPATVTMVLDPGIIVDSSALFTVTAPSDTASIQSSVTIAGTCGISTTGTLQYGTLIPSATSPEQILTVQNTGTVSAALLVSGTDWLDGSSVNQINAGNTKWSTSPGTAFNAKTSLTLVPVIMTSILDIAPATLPTYWQLQANLNHGTFTGSLTQTVLLSVSC